jgi:hypothetical protein
MGGKRLITEEDKIEAKKRRNISKYKWAEVNKEKFDAYNKEYYQKNKERLDKRNTELKKQKALIKKEAEKTSILSIP